MIFYLLKIKEIKKNDALEIIIKGPAGIPVNLKPIIPKMQDKLPSIIPP